MLMIRDYTSNFAGSKGAGLFPKDLANGIVQSLVVSAHFFVICGMIGQS